MTQSEQLGRRMRRLRVERGLTQADLSAPDYTAAYISTIEAGRRIPSPAALAHFARKLEVDPEELATGRPTALPADLRFKLHDGLLSLYSAEYEAADKLFLQIEEAASTYGMDRIRAQARVGLAISAERRGDPSEASKNFEEARVLLQNEPASLWVEAIAGLARCAQLGGEVREAIHILETYLLVLKKNSLPDPLALMRAHSSLIWPYTEVGLFKKAREAAAEALRLEPKVDDANQVANMHLNVARELLREGRSGDAMTSLQRAEDLYTTLNWKTEIARAHAARGIVLAEEGDLEGGRKELQVSLKLIEGTPDSLIQSRALNELAIVERMAGNDTQAVEILTRSLEMLVDSDVVELALANHEMARCLSRSNPKKAEEHLNTAIRLYERADKSLQAATAYRELGDLLSEQGELDRGRSAYREGLVSLEPA
ncbi:MAG TPA: tetratricopeptide repeat protein [Actinomycetota bacterium]|nr:tetratricopeptide repeat protein [Actinomycetota bacterium]